MDRFTGGCQCGNVRIVASGLPYRVGLCHCLDCRKHHGALFHASAVFPQDAVTIDGETRDYAGRFFCPRCGSSIFARTADEIEVNVGSLDAPDQLMPTYESWIRLRIDDDRLAVGANEREGPSRAGREPDLIAVAEGLRRRAARPSCRPSQSSAPAGARAPLNFNPGKAEPQ